LFKKRSLTLQSKSISVTYSTYLRVTANLMVLSLSKPHLRP